MFSAETNAPTKQRAAISERWKLIYYFATNLYELYDLVHDPWEHTNVAASQPAALAPMKQALEAWMDRVMYARDPKFNQAFQQMSDVMLAEAPKPGVATAGTAFAGLDARHRRRRRQADRARRQARRPAVLRVRAPSTEPIKFQLEVAGRGGGRAADRRLPIRRASCAPACGRPPRAFSAERWKQGVSSASGSRSRSRATGTRRGSRSASTPLLAAAQIAPTGPALANAPSVAVLGTPPFAGPGLSGALDPDQKLGPPPAVVSSSHAADIRPRERVREPDPHG